MFIAILIAFVLVLILTPLAIIINRKIVREDLLGQAVLLSITSRPDQWEQVHFNYYRHPELSVKRERTGYYVNSREITGTLGRRIFRILSIRERNRQAKENKDFGQVMLDIAIKEAQDKLKAIQMETQK